MADARPSVQPVDFDPLTAASARPTRLALTVEQSEMRAAAAVGREANCSCHQCFAVTLDGPLRVESLRAALDQAVARHEALRAVIDADGAGQTLRPPFGVELPLFDLSTLDPSARRRQLDALLQLECETPFDLVEGPLVRAFVVRESAQRHRFVLTVHQIVCDAWSSSLLFSELGSLYAADRVGIAAQLSPAASYRDYVAEQTSHDHVKAAAADEAYWAARYPTGAPVLDLPLAGDRPATKTYRSRREHLRIGNDLYSAVKATAARSEATLFATLLAVYEALVYRVSGQSDFVVGIPVAGHPRLGNPSLVAHCINTVPLRARLDPATPFAEHLRTVHHELAHAQDHARIALGSLERRLQVPEDRSRTPLVATGFTIDKIGAPFDFGDVTIASISAPKSYSSLELLVNIVDSGSDMVVECDYNAALFDGPTLRRWLSHYETLLHAIVARPDDTLDASHEAFVSRGGTGLARSAAAAEPPAVVELPLTDGQQDILLAARLGDEVSCSYNISSTLHITGALDVPALRRAAVRLVSRHDALRVTFTADGTRQRVAEGLALEVPLVDLSALDGPERAKALEVERLAEVETPFDLVAGPLIRVRLIRVAGEEHHLFLTVHHAVCDGWSSATLMRHFTELYGVERRGGAESDAALLMQLPEYVEWFERYRGSDDYAVDKAFWLDHVAGTFPETDLPGDRPRPARKTYRADRRTRPLGPELLAGVRQLATAEGCTTFTALLGSFECLLARLTGREEVGLAVTIAGHTRFPGRDLVAHCVNALPLRRPVAVDESFSHHLAGTRTALLDAFDHQDFSLGAIVRGAGVQRDSSRMPFVSIIFNMDAPVAPLEMDGAVAILGSNARRYENFDVFVDLIPRGDDVEVECTYNTDLFDADTIDRRLEEWVTLLADLVRSGGAKPVGELSVVAPPELARIQAWNATSTSAAVEQTIVSQFAQAVERSPDAVALELADGVVSYRELSGLARRVAGRLVELGVGRGSMVGVLCDRSAQLVASVYGVLLAGAAYVPLEPEQPPARLAFMVRETGMQVIICRGRCDARLTDHAVAVLDLDELLAGEDPALDVALPQVHPDDLAYVIYTSGSTGRPKGVANAHRGPVNLCWWMQDRLRLGPGDVALLKAPFGFDMSVQELFWPLQAGARLVVAAPDGNRDPEYLVETVRRFGVTNATFVPLLLRAFLDQPHADACTSLRTIICGGEAMTRELRDRFFAVLPSTELHNFYGPTEAAVWVTAGRCGPDDPGTSVPIGAPMANTSVHILDGRMKPLPVGIPGELHIGGLQVAAGYVNRDDLTAERFVADPRDPPGRLYRTGDLARWLPDGQLEYLGRLDRQVKFHGQRIELGEIEVTLGEHPTVLEAAVVLRKDAAGDPALIAYVVQRPGQSMDPTAIRDHLRERLPAAMIPAHYTVLDALPLTANGKLDQAALPAPDRVDARAAAGDTIEPRTELEREIAAMWTEVLAVDRVGAETDFFDLGGHSLKLMQLASRMEESFGLRLALARLFEAPTVAGQAVLVTNALIGEGEPDDEVLAEALEALGLER